MRSFNQEAYLRRIGVRSDLPNNPDSLGLLHRQHLYSIPFENLDIHYGNTIRLDTDRIFEKVVLNGRGGFCYELNGLFYELLKSLGYEVKRIMARVYDEGKGYGEPFDHLAVVVTISDVEYLCDVGFGAFITEPLKLIPGEPQEDEQGIFIFEEYDNEYLRMSKVENNGSSPEYIFINDHFNFTDFEEMCNYHQTDERSHFTQKMLITIPTKQGRITLTNQKLKITNRDGETEVSDINDENEFLSALEKHFNINRSKLA